MLLVTGSQGERRAASAALARGSYLGHELKAGDMFLFSSKTIPGNEVPVARIQNALAEQGVDVDRRRCRASTMSRAMPIVPIWRRCTN